MFGEGEWGFAESISQGLSGSNPETGVGEMSFPSGARAAVGLPSVPPQRLIRNDCSSRDTRSRGCTANLRHKIAKGAVAQDSEHIRSCTLSH